MCFFFFNLPATTESDPSCTPLPLHDALPICPPGIGDLVAVLVEQDTERGILGPCRRQLGKAHAFQSMQGRVRHAAGHKKGFATAAMGGAGDGGNRSEEHTSELKSLMRISYAVFCLKKKKTLKRQRTKE